MNEQPERRDGPRIPGSPAVAAGLAAGFALCALAVGGLMIFSYLDEGDAAQLDSARMRALRRALARKLSKASVPAEHKNALREEIRREDARFRRVYFAARRQRQWGGYILVGFMALMLLSFAWRRALLRQRDPAKLPPIAKRTRASLRWPQWAATATFGGMLAAFFAMVALAETETPPDDWRDRLAAATPATKPATQTFLDNWPRFRGPGGQGIVATAGRSYPDTWNIETGQNILWKTKVELPGKSSPILWGKRVFLTGGDARRRVVLCYDRSNGKPLWTALIRTPPGVKLEVEGEPLEIFEDTGWAAPTPVTDGKRVYAMFASGDVAAVDFDGKVKWVRNIGVPDSAYSFAASPVLHKDRLIIQLDQGFEAGDGKSELIALDIADGKAVWSEPRPVGGSWSTPVIFKTPSGEQLITCANPWVIAYEPVAGTEIWRAKILDGDVAPAPVYADGVVFVTNDMAFLAAIKTNGTGDVSETHVLWKGEDALPDIASPLTDGTFVLQGRDDGEMACYNAKTGKKLWDHYADDGFKASPSLLAGVLYWPDNIGNTLLFKLAGEFKLIRKNDLHEPLAATPAFGDSRIYFRGTKHLFCVGPKQ